MLDTRRLSEDENQNFQTHFPCLSWTRWYVHVVIEFRELYAEQAVGKECKK